MSLEWVVNELKNNRKIKNEIYNPPAKLSSPARAMSMNNKLKSISPTKLRNTSPMKRDKTYIKRVKPKMMTMKQSTEPRNTSNMK